MSSSTLTRRDPSANSSASNGQLLVLEPVAAHDLESVVLAPGRYHVGSGEDCDVRVTVPGVAPRHCLIVVGPHRSVVKSLAPLTWLNDGVFREAALRPGDRLVAGPIEWTVGGVSSLEETARRGSRESDGRQLLCDDASSRIELSQAALKARREWEQLRRVDHPVTDHAPAPTPQPTPSSAAINEQRAHLVELAASLTAREQEVIARETDVRCHWEDVQKNWSAVRELDRLVRSERAAVAAERAEVLTERQAISAVRRELDEARAELGRRALDLTERESAQQLRADDVVESHSLLATRTTELQRREAELAEREERLGQAEAQVAERQQELEHRREQVDRQNAELAEREQRLAQHESASPDHDQGLEQSVVESEQQRAEVTEREERLAQREQSCAEREHELQCRSEELERRHADVSAVEQQQSQHESARAEQAHGLEQRARELEQWQAANADRDSQLSQREQSCTEREHQLGQRDDSQNQRDEELSRREHETSARSEALSEREGQLAEREAECAARQQAAEQLEHREQECARREQHQAELDADHARRLEALAQRELAINVREHQLADGDAELESRGHSLSQTDEQLAQREQECARREQLLSQFDADHAERVQERSRRDEELNSKERQLNEQSRELSQRESQAADRDQQQTGREQELASREDQLGRREQDVCRREQELEHRNEQISRREHELSQLDDQVARREQELGGRAETYDQQDAALAQRAAEIAQREAETLRREQELAEQQRLIEEERASLGSIAEAAASAGAAADNRDAQDAEIAELRQALADRQRQLDDAAEQLRADRSALEVAQRELESRWGGIECEKAALDDRRSELEREIADFATARDELEQLRSSHEADDAIWDKRRALLDAREQELEARAAQLDRVAADLAARSHDQPLSPQQTLLLGGPIAELLARPENSDWDSAAPAINQAASKDLLDERIALDEMRSKIEAERDELAALRAEWDAKVAVDSQRHVELEEEQSRIATHWDEFRAARAEHERELAVFSEQRHELRRQLREFAIAQGAPVDLMLVDELSDPQVDAPVLSAEPATVESDDEQPDVGLSSEHVEVEPPVDEAGADAPVATGDDAAPEAAAVPATNESADLSEEIDGCSGVESEAPPESIMPPQANDNCATMEIDCAAFVDEFGQERLFNDGSATLPVGGELPFGSPDIRSNDNLAEQNFISSTGVYDAGALLAESQSDEPLDWPPAGGPVDAEDDASRETDEKPAGHDSVLALRARLAEMFGLSGSTVRVHDTPPKIPIRNVIDTVDASQHNFEAEREAAFSNAPEVAVQLESDPDLPAQEPDLEPHAEYDAEPPQYSTPTPPPHGTNTEESIAAYMQQLLARSKPKLEVPADLLSDPVTSDSRTKLVTPVVVEPPPPPPPPKAIAPEDKEAIRANLDSFRELANISARSAVAKHQSTKLQTVVQIKFIVLGIAMGLTVLLWVAGWFNKGSYLAYTTAAAIASIVMLADVVRTTLAISRLKSMEAAGEYEVESSVSPAAAAPGDESAGPAGD